MMIIDDYIKDQRLLETLNNPTLWQKEPFSGWYEGWWQRVPETFWERIIYNIWRHYPNVAAAKGFEWWTNTHSGGGLDWHQDKDEELCEASGRVINPEYGAILYPFKHDIEGGFLEIEYNNDPDSVERIAPAHNRLIMFDPSSSHRVSKVYSGQRRAFIVNLWMNHKPLFTSVTK
jgi:hypothetical protein